MPRRPVRPPSACPYIADGILDKLSPVAAPCRGVRPPGQVIVMRSTCPSRSLPPHPKSLPKLQHTRLRVSDVQSTVPELLLMLWTTSFPETYRPASSTCRSVSLPPLCVGMLASATSTSCRVQIPKGFRLLGAVLIETSQPNFGPCAYRIWQAMEIPGQSNAQSCDLEAEIIFSAQVGSTRPHLQPYTLNSRGSFL